MYNKCIYGFIFFLSFFSSFFDLIHISQMDIIMTAKHVMHNNFLFVFNKHNRGDIQLRFKQNKHHPFKPIFSMIFFFLQTNAPFFFHSLKYYTVKKKQCIFLCSPVTVGGQTATIFYYAEMDFSVHPPEYFLKLAEWKYFNAFNSFCFTQRVLITVVHDMSYYIQSI